MPSKNYYPSRVWIRLTEMTVSLHHLSTAKHESVSTTVPDTPIRFPQNKPFSVAPHRGSQAHQRPESCLDSCIRSRFVLQEKLFSFLTGFAPVTMLAACSPLSLRGPTQEGRGNPPYPSRLLRRLQLLAKTGRGNKTLPGSPRTERPVIPPPSRGRRW